MHIIYTLLAFTALMAFSTASAQTVCRPLPRVAQATPQANPTFTFTGAQWRDDLTRLSLNMRGTPHTSNRIDSVTIVVGQHSYGATDIDGVDMKRYFQFEEDPVIPLEIDFPAFRRRPMHYRLIFHTVHGDVEVPFTPTRRATK